MHVARANLDHVAVTFDEIDAGFVQRFGNDLQAVGVTHVGEYPEPFFAETLKRVRRGARLERAAAKETRAAATHGFGDGKRLLRALDRARTSDDRQLVAADRRVANAHHRLFRPQVERNQLVRLTDANSFRDAREIFKVRRIDRALVAGDADRGASGAGHRMALESQFLDNAQHSLDLASARVGFHDN